MGGKVTKTSIKKRLDKLFSLIVRSKGYCERCGRKEGTVVLHCSHIYSRRHLSVRWDETNAKSLCAGCHQWWHTNPKENCEWLMEIRTEGQLIELRRKKETIKKWSVTELLQLEEELKNKLKELC